MITVEDYAVKKHRILKLQKKEYAIGVAKKQKAEQLSFLE
jgi:hypothetical protein